MTSIPKYRQIGVFCGAKPSKPRYLELATEFGTWLGGQGMDLVYGGGSTGLMGAVAEAARNAGSYVTGVVPHHLLGEEGDQPQQVELVVVRSMHERKALMYRLSDAFVTLPGGVGTLDELMEIITWAKLGLHSKPVLVLNSGGFFDGLLGLLDHAVQEGMMTPADRLLVRDVTTIDAVAAHLNPTPTFAASA
jgi:uncharacterized protein (TIGR00730 family)